MKFGVSDGAEASDSGHHQPELGTPSEGDPHSPLEVERHPHHSRPVTTVTNQATTYQLIYHPR